MIVLGIESTAHTFGIGIVTRSGTSCKVLANVRAAFTTEEGGMRPFEVADHHSEHARRVFDEALVEAKLTIDDVDVIAFSRGPGIGQMLKVGAFFARYLALKYSKPLVGVNHCVAHLSIGEGMTDAHDAVLLYASGANTQVIAFEGGQYRVFGETLDMGVGNLLDQLAREMGLGFPGGPLIEKKAVASELIELPYDVKGMDVNFGGLFSHVRKLITSKEYPVEALCYSLQETVFAMLVEIAERALADTGKKHLLLGGGVGCNARLQEMCEIMCSERGASFYVPPRSVLIDNGVMIGWLGLLEFEAGKQDNPKIVQPLPYWRTDEVKF